MNSTTAEKIKPFQMTASTSQVFRVIRDILMDFELTAGRADLVIGESATSLAGVYAYPNPFAGRGPSGEEAVMFAGLPAEALIRIFDLRGVLVRELHHHNAVGGTTWDLRNDERQAVAGGIYIYTVESGSHKSHGKLAVLR